MFEPLYVDLPGTLIFEATEWPVPTITAVEPVDRDELRNYIAYLRNGKYRGEQVPFRVIHKNVDTGEEREEHIPGCATCSI